jgi:hypothetical protein
MPIAKNADRVRATTRRQKPGKTTKVVRAAKHATVTTGDVRIAGVRDPRSTPRR